MKETNLPTVSVVVPSRNRCERLPRMLDALQAEPAEEIIVAVNGDDDGSTELVQGRARTDPRLKSIYLPPPGRAEALQAGIEAASGEVALILDDDVIARPGLVAGHARHHAKRDNLVVVGYMPMRLAGRRRPGQYPAYLYARAYEAACLEYDQNPDSILLGLWEGNVSLRRADALQVGLGSSDALPEDHWYHDDRDFGLRCRDAGLEALFDRALLSSHEHRATPQGFLRTSRESGYMRWAMHDIHRQSLGPLANDFFERSAPMPGRLLVRLARARLLEPWVRFLLNSSIRIAGSLRLFRLETHGAYLLGKVEQQRGFLEAAARFKTVRGRSK